MVAKAKQPKKVSLTLDKMKKDNKQYDKRQKIIFEDEQFSFITPIFSNVKLEEMFLDFGNFINDYENTGNQVDERLIMNYMYLFIVLHFSELVEYDSEMSFENKITVLTEMMRHKYVAELESHFAEQEVQKVYDLMFKKLEMMQKMMKQNGQMKEQLLKELEGKNLKNWDTIKDVFFESEDILEDLGEVDEVRK
jgi:hypothetical protein